MLKFEFSKTFHAKYDKFTFFHIYSYNVEMVWWLKL